MATKQYLDKNGLAYLWAQIKNALLGKVDKVDGKGLSSNDYTADEKAKLANIAAGAEVNVNADWNASTGDAAILNKPTIPSAATSTPLMDGTGAVGSSAKYAKEDHVHPSDTNKVDKVSGKGLSTNDYTTAEKNKLSGIAAGAEVNVQSDWSVTSSSSDAFIKNKPTIPSKVSDLTNDSGFATTTYVDDEIAEAIGSITGIDFEVVQTLPQTGEKGVIYLVPNSGTGTNTYDEYIWLTNRFEKIGTTDVDLSGYQLSAELIAITNAEIDTIVAS